MFYSPYEGEDDLYCIPLGLAMIYNHSETPNAEWDVNEEDDNFIRFYALQDIAKGQEILHDYGTIYWSSREAA